MKLLRKPSETPNINPVDDYRAMFYAVGGKNGYTSGKGTEFNYEVVGSEFRLLSGELFLFGAQAEVEGSGEVFVIDNVSSKRYYSLYCEIDLRNSNDQKGTAKLEYDSLAYPVIETGDNFTVNANGLARIELYRFTAINGIISDVAKRIEKLKYMAEEIELIYEAIQSTLPEVIWSGEAISDTHEYVQIDLGANSNKVNIGDNFKIYFESDPYREAGTVSVYEIELLKFNPVSNGFNSFVGSYVASDQELGQFVPLVYIVPFAFLKDEQGNVSLAFHASVRKETASKGRVKVLRIEKLNK